MPTIRLDLPAYENLMHFFKEHPEILIEELMEHNIDPFKSPDEFFEEELTSEPWHHSILEQAAENRYIVTGPMIDEWIHQELEE